MSLTPLVVKELLPKMGLRFYPEWGILYPIYSALFLVFPGYAQYEMGREIGRTKGTERARLIYFFVALALAFSGGVSLFLLIFNLPVPPYLSVLIILYPPMMAYTILVYRFMDIEVIIKRTLVFTGLFSFIFGLFAFFSFLVTDILQQSTSGAARWGILGIVTLLVALGSRKLEAFLTDLTDRYLFQKRIDYKVLLKEASQEMATIKSLKRLSRLIVGFLIKRARISKIAVYVRPDKDYDFSLHAARPLLADSQYYTIQKNHPLILYFETEKRILEIYELENWIRESEKKEAEKYEPLLGIMKTLKAEAVIPSFLGRMTEGMGKPHLELRSLLFLGAKKSDEPYSQEDLDIFYTLAQESAIAIENARLYDEAILRTEELARMNQELRETNERLKVTQASLIVAEKNATMVGMAKAIGHEINNPLSTVVYRAQSIYTHDLKKCKQLIEKSANLIPEADFQSLTSLVAQIDDHTRRISRSGDRINVVVKTLTNILKDTKGEMTPLSLIVLCREAIEATRFSTYEENLAGCEIRESIVANIIIQGNLEQLIQVFVNLIKNAYEAMSHQNNRKIEILGDVDPDDPKMARIEFLDNGPGIPPEVLPKIWLQGFSTKNKKGDSIGAAGQGQGLFICKHMIESIHKGTITAESMPGTGTTFIIRLPLAEMGKND